MMVGTNEFTKKKTINAEESISMTDVVTRICTCAQYN